MKKIILLFTIIVLFSCFVFVDQVKADTEVGGNIDRDTIWTLENSPYIVIDTVQVLKGIKLTIKSGVEIKFNEDTGLKIGGELNAVGTNADNIIFTSSLVFIHLIKLTSMSNCGGITTTGSCYSTSIPCKNESYQCKR